MTHYLYDNGLPFSDIIDRNLRDTYDRVQDNKASLIIIDGQIGQGKTTLGVHVIDRINSYQRKPPTDLEAMKQLGLGGEQFLEKLRICYEEKLPVAGYDEAGDFNRRGALTKFNAILNRTFETYRAFRIIPVLMLPAFWVLDNEFFDKGIPRLLLHLHGRTKHQGEISGYSLYRMYYLKAKMRKLTVPQQAYNLVRPNFRGHFLDLPPARSAQLDKQSTAGKIEILQKGELQSQGLVSIEEISRRVGRGIPSVRYAINACKIKWRKKVRAKHYYYNDDLVQVQQYYYDLKGHSHKNR